MKVFQIWSHDYMDKHPVDHLYTFASQEEADAYVEHMRKNWSGGTTSNAKMLTKEEVIRIAHSPSWKDYTDEILTILSKCDYED